MNYNELVDIPSMGQLSAMEELSRIVTESFGDINVLTSMDTDWDRGQTPPVLTVRFLLHCESADVREMFRAMGATESVEALEDAFFHHYFHVFRLGNAEFRIFDDSEEVM